MDSYFGKRSKRSVNRYSDWDEIAYPETRAAHGRGGIALFLIGALLVCVVGAVVVPAGAGALAGYQQLQQQNQENASLHYQRGLGYLAENYPELAYTEFELALKYDGALEPAQQKLDELNAFDGRGKPGAADQNVAPALFEQAKNFVAKKQWSDGIVRLEQLQTLSADYRTREVSDLLYQAYVEGGKEAVGLLQIELARERFDAALAINGKDAEIKRQRDLAQLYLEGQQYAGSNWQIAATKFAALYAQDANYADVKKRAVEAYLGYGDNAAKTGAWCLALREYEAAVAISNEPSVAQKRSQASAQCKQILASPPTPTLTAAENYSWKISTANIPACAGSGDLSGSVRDAAGKGISSVTIAYTTDAGARTTTTTNGSGAYQFALGKDAGVLHVSIVGADGKTPASAVVDVNYPGGVSANCRMVLEWQRSQ
ncbi:MAG: carboxypeptidase regulatory-like domain-containing protein [Chloroflexi bacterium]|nr:carboxypeptidase regulatory-like domain-containing protein [Chloroflexota bacterium]